MMAVRASDVMVLSLVVLYMVAAVNSIDLAQLLAHRQQIPHKKNLEEGNPCPKPEKPFPCRSTPTCIPMAYVCDDNFDCEDGYDEDLEVCTAAHRPPVEDIMQFLEAEKSWMLPSVFGGKGIGKIAHGLAVSRTVDDFKRRAGLTVAEIRNLKEVLDAVRHGDEVSLEHLGMPPSAWNEVVFFFSKLIKSGFDG